MGHNRGHARATADDLYRRFTAALERGADESDRRRRLMLEIGDAIRELGSLPKAVEQLSNSIIAAWRGPEAPAAGCLLHAATVVWQTLESRNGNTTTIQDRVDRTLRATLCLTERGDDEELSTSAGWAAEMLSTEQ